MSSPPFYRPCWADIDLGALRHNFRELKRRISAKTRVMTVVKADGYGHGLVPAARAAVSCGASFLGVSSLEEGVALRRAGVRAPVLVLGTLYPFGNFPVLFREKLVPTVASPGTADALNRLAHRRRERLPVHLKIDTGFGRIGVSVPNALKFIEHAAGCSGLMLQGLFTHFSSSDVDPAATRAQAGAFWTVVRGAAAKGIRPPWIHLANSSALLRFPQTHGTMVRPGLAFYGAVPYAGADRVVSLRPALTWKTKVIYLKTVPKGFTVSYARTWKASRATRVATLAVGYADGYPRSLSNQGEVLLKGRRARVIGRVTMDMMMVDATGIPSCRIGDEAVLIGAQGGERLTVEEVAGKARTNAYEILSRIAGRVPRIYHEQN
ncbi:MAG: alanine racemase [Elusimicrobia bacterium RIFCSPLOWO2_01_FULL_59_12]|nr:MAG: alanine racemase [Elusimicrobia bacterium RIFCSPLOWO2_01_FULL_59_12]